MNLRIVTRKSWFGRSKLIVQKECRVLEYPGMGTWVNRWFDCDEKDATNVILELFCKEKTDD